MADTAKQTALHSWHETHGAKMVEFAGWHLPLTYKTGAVEEHHHTRSAAGLFDISHMGRLSISGGSAAESLNRIISSNITSLPVGLSTYGLLCNQNGGILDDVFVFRLSREHFVVVVNAANTAKAERWIDEHLSKDASLENWSDHTSMFALQGPKAIDVLSTVSGYNAHELDRFAVVERKIGDTIWQISRTGYTGEDGVEIVVPALDSMAIWSALEAPAAVAPAGLAARDSLRFEPGFALYGHEITEERTPVEARLLWACDLSTDFIGRDAIVSTREHGVEQKLVTFTMSDRAVPREECRVLNSDGEPIGEVVTGLYAPTIDAFAGNAYVRLEYSKIGSTIGVEIRNRVRNARVVKRPLYRPAYRSTK